MKGLLRSHSIALILVFSLLYQISNILIYRNSFYGDAIKELSAGSEFLQTKTHVLINSKFYFTTVLNALIDKHFGALGVKGFHVLCFILLFFMLFHIGKYINSPTVVALALFLFSFYPGTSLNVIANETADIVYAVIFAFAVLVFKRTEKAFLPSILMGVAFWFKHITGVFFVGFLAYLTFNRLWKQSWHSAIGFALPPGVVWMIDPLLLREFLDFICVNANYDTWGQVIFKLFSTGMLPIFLMALMEFCRNRTSENALLFLIPFPYLVYAICSRNAYSASYIMSFCMMFLAFLLASYLLSGDHFAGKKKPFLALFVAMYLVGSIVIVQKNLHYDTEVPDWVSSRAGCAESIRKR